MNEMLSKSGLHSDTNKRNINSILKNIRLEVKSKLSLRLITFIAIATLALVACTPPPAKTPESLVSNDPVVMAVGDIVCATQNQSSTECQDKAVANVVINQKPDAVLILGDQCHDPSAYCYDERYNSNWGSLFNISYPVPGNHEYFTPGASPYYDYWNGKDNQNGRAGNRNEGFYSFDLGGWHLIALNSECEKIGGCEEGSPQNKWLEQDLQNNRKLCTLAYYHKPLFSSGPQSNPALVRTFRDLEDYGVDVVVNGHDHDFERFAPQDADGKPDPNRGINEFVVGTGGASLLPFTHIQPNSLVRNNHTFGALRFVLHPTSYDWKFIPVKGETFTASGSSNCH